MVGETTPTTYVGAHRSDCASQHVGKNAPKEWAGAQSPSQLLLQSSNEGLLAQRFSEEDIRGHDGPPAKDGAKMDIASVLMGAGHAKAWTGSCEIASTRLMTVDGKKGRVLFRFSARGENAVIHFASQVQRPVIAIFRSRLGQDGGGVVRD